MMPLEYLLRGAHRKFRRSCSSHVKRNTRSKEHSTVSLEDYESVGNYGLELTELDNKSATPCQWRSTSCLPTGRDPSAKIKSTPKTIPSPKALLTHCHSSEGPKMDSTSGREKKPKSYHSSVKKKLSNYEHLSKLEFGSDGYRLTGQQRELLRLYWQQAHSRQGDIGRFVFNWILPKYPLFKTIFRIEKKEDERFHKHVQSFTSLMELIISSVVSEADYGHQGCSISLDDTTGPLLHCYGAKHAQIESDRGDDVVKPEHWDIFKTAMCEYGSNTWRPNLLSITSSGHKRNEAVHAWRILVYYVIAKVNQGYEMEKNERRKRGRGRSVAD